LMLQPAREDKFFLHLFNSSNLHWNNLVGLSFIHCYLFASVIA
jgi:hypothetical protein